MRRAGTSGLNESWIYRRAGLKGLKIFWYVWFPLHFLLFGGILLLAIFLLEGRELVVPVSLTILGALLLTRMFVSVYVQLKSIRNDESRDAA